MMKVKVENPTHKAKAVRIPGDLAIIKPGKSRVLEVDLSEQEHAKYEKAGLVFSDPSEKKKTKKRQGLEAQAEKAGVEFTDDTTDDALIEAIKAAKAAG